MADKDYNFEEFLTEEKVKPKVRLWHAGGTGLILPHKSGIIYTNQTGGRGCSHPELEGYYIPLVDEQLDLQKLFFEYFSGPKWNRWCTRSAGIDKETADYINTVLKKSTLTQGLQVDKESLDKSHEAWIKVIIDKEKIDSDLPLMEDVEKSWGILTWKNSD
ncbi:hypothetical protein SAMN05443144_13038 [Fodinibius roseus]|uniref:Uncharacterized protein n=1 Tax=Fodinibius roseus TaxID=1194090 RepID=A0A1M5KCC4_9BACT|nr:DUF6210 family protein [Fodinibius roseus]SHG49823.1 hypothetical protein SAMN05443144_13038 [Fodinibius roseus]